VKACNTIFGNRQWKLARNGRIACKGMKPTNNANHTDCMSQVRLQLDADLS